ncbi:MAG TPA: type III-A CRISPR-associated RAMP protein Csm3 [Lachnospiraceae bacterium]|nr:type III-A CRISPR-associated RAMP protein Csm3 [Lachnospiraceae bacterium]
MYSKIQITGSIEVVTGMHIGGSPAFAAIGAVDSPIIRDVSTNLPMIPGSSLKGKMRTLLAKAYNDTVVQPDDDNPRITRVFGSAKQNNIHKSRFLFSDMILSNQDELRKMGLQSLTEVKFENSIRRATAVATPRQIERAVRGSEFKLDIMYEAEEEKDVIEDMELLAEGMQLLQYDYLGGSGSRGYGRVLFKDVYAEVVVGEIDESIINKCNETLQAHIAN